MATTSVLSPSVATRVSSSGPTLTSDQLANANLIYQTATKNGLNSQQALEMVGASMAESGLNENNVNGKSGAFGLFQLLSSGYVNTYQNYVNKGYSPSEANILAILPDYKRNFQANQGAPMGTVAALTEKSGEGASFYAAGTNNFLTALKNGGFGSIAAYAGSHSTSFTASLKQIPLVGGTVGGAVQGAESAVNATESVGHFLGDLTNPNFWIRALEMIAGFALVGLGLYLVLKDMGIPTPDVPTPAKRRANELESLLEEAKFSQAQARVAEGQSRVATAQARQEYSPRVSAARAQSAEATASSATFTAEERVKQQRAKTSEARAKARSARQGATEAKRRAERARAVEREQIFGQMASDNPRY